MMMHDRRPVGLSLRFALVIATAIALVALCTAGVAALETEIVSPRMVQVPARGGGMKLAPDEAASGQVLARVAAGVTNEQLQARLESKDCTLVRQVPHTPLIVIGLPEGMSVNEGVQMWSGESVIADVEPDRLAHLYAEPDDPLYADQWHWPLIAADLGWDTQTGSTNIVVAVVDSGYDPDHEDLVDKYWVNTAEEAGTPGVDDDGNGFVDDINGWDFWQGDNDPDARPEPEEPYFPGAVSHGTHVAGLIGATTNNATGVAGHDWGCQIMPVRVFGPFAGSPTSLIISGVQYAIDNGADVINLSLGGMFTDMWDPVIENAHSAGIVVVAAAGNESVVFSQDQSTWSSPVCNDGPNLGEDNYVLGVAATDRNDLAADFTNRDASGYNFVDVSAPGVEDLSTWYHDPTLPGHEMAYGEMSGTSMACPVTAGLASLVLAQYPAFSPDDVINQIRQSADDISDQNPLIYDTLGEGRINTAAALGLDIPPDPVTNLIARDTMGDEGGSITVTWSLPPQDDQDVIQYRLLRAEEDPDVPGAYGDFSEVAVLEPGTSFYVDAPVPNSTPYWYQVITQDASNSVPSEISNPAEARDDLAPDPVDNLVAVDTQADDGGSISLSWFGYRPAEDLVEYRIYRSTMEFTDVSEMEPMVTMEEDEGQNYLDRTTNDGTEYWYAVTGVDDWENENTTVSAVGPAISNPNFSFNYPAGLSIIAAGAVPSGESVQSMADLLGLEPGGDANLAYWDPTSNGGEYIIWSRSPTAGVFNHQLARAWWLKTDEPVLLNLSGEAAPPGNYEKQVNSGWTMVGNPFPNALDFAATQVTDIGQGTPVSLETSNQLGFTRDYAWTYDTLANSYRLVTGADLPFAETEIGKGRGVMMLAQRPATLILKRPVAPAADADETSVALDGWVLRMVAEAEGARDTDNFLGVSSNADQLSGMVSPPRPDADLDLYFVRPSADGGRLATDFVRPEAESEWEIRVRCARPGATVRLSWPDLTTLPDDCRPILVDEQTGRAIYLRTTTGYTYEAGEEPTDRSFTLHTASDGAGALAINTFSATAADSRGQIVYSLSAPAAVDVEVLNIAGVTVRRVAQGVQQAAGTQQLVWDGRNQSGSPAPGGTYLVRITARSENGQRVSAIRSLQLDR